MIEPIHSYNKSHPFLASISERYTLCKPGSEKNTCHVVINLSDSGITYQVGDSIAVQPLNDPEVVENMIRAMNATGDETILDKHTKEAWSLKEFLTRKSNLANVSKKLIVELSQRQMNFAKKDHLQFLLKEREKEALKEYQGAHEVWDALEENSEAIFAPQEICNILQPLLPRFYSIASSMSAVGTEAHLTVAELEFVTNGHIRRGTCTHYLCQLAPLHEWNIPVYIQSSNGFTIPSDLSADLIMVGPGTGIAPFRAFLQEREIQKAAGLNWIFFGERHRAYEFFYEDYWNQMIKVGKLRLDTAFSRDQEHKIYVQHRMIEHGEEIFKLLETGAYFYVCGDAHRMAKDVDNALHQIIQLHGRCGEQGSKDYVKKLKLEKRYLRDVY